MKQWFWVGYELLKDAGLEFWRDNGPRLAAALAYYTALSLAPLLVVVIAIAGFVFGEEAARGELAHQIRELVGAQGAEAVQMMLAAQHRTGGGVFATVVSVVTLLVGSTAVFVQLQDAINTAWGAQPDQDSGGVWGMVRERLLSFTFVCALAFLLLVSLVVSALLSGLSGIVNDWFPYAATWLGLANVLISLLLTGVMFAMIFKILPPVRPTWSDVGVGAAVTAVLFGVGKYLIGLYLGQAAVGSAYGAAGSFVVLLVWIYYSTWILLFGVEITQVYAARHGSGLKANKPPLPSAEGRPAPSVQPAVS